MKLNGPFSQILFGFQKLGEMQNGLQKIPNTCICIGPGYGRGPVAPTQEREIYTRTDFKTEQSDIRKYAEQIVRLIENTDDTEKKFIFDFLVAAPDRKKFEGINDMQNERIKWLYSGFMEETKKRCKGDLNILKRMELPILKEFVRVDLIGFKAKCISTSKTDVDKAVYEHYRINQDIEIYNGAIVDADIFFEEMEKLGYKLTIYGQKLTFQNYLLYTLSGRKADGVIKIPVTEKEEEQPTMTLTKRIPIPGSRPSIEKVV